MKPEELFPLLWDSIRGHKLRSSLTVLGIVIGMMSVVLLSSIGEGTRRAIASSFSQFGTTLITVQPGKSETMGLGAMAGTTRKLTWEDAKALTRIGGVRDMTANVYGVAHVEWGRKSRSVYINGVTAEAERVWSWTTRRGTYIPEGDPAQTPAVCTLGSKLARELFGTVNPLGETVRIGEAKFTVIGVMEEKGQFLGFDFDDCATIPLFRAMRLFNRFEVNEINIHVASFDAIDRVEREIKRILIDRHDEEDFTIITQKAMLEAIDEIMAVITKGAVAIAGIAIFVGAIGILTITWVSVHERTGEIGLMKAVGASNFQVMFLFLGEAVSLAILGGIAGIALGLGSGFLLQSAVPALRVVPAPGIIPIILGVSMLVGALAGYLPARRAARMDPVTALREE